MYHKHFDWLSELLSVDVLVRKPLDNVHSVVLVGTSKDEIMVEIMIAVRSVSAALLYEARKATYSE